jgi:tetratricopeptide (TPR) repeat protein
VGASDLIDRGVKAYLAGREKDALEAFRQVLAAEPENAKARWYLEKLGAARRVKAAVGAAAPPPAPAAAPAAEGRVQLDLAAELHSYFTPPPATAPAPRAPPPDASLLPRLEEDHAPSPWDEGPAARATIHLEETGGLDLGAVSEKSDLRPLVPEGARPILAPRSDVEVWLAAAKELFALGDFSGSLELIEKILQVDPDHGEARDYLRQNEATLISMYESKLGSLTCVPRLAIKPEEVLWLNLDHRAGFLLAQIDGMVDYDSLFALSGLPRLDTARILANLIADGVVTS